MFHPSVAKPSPLLGQENKFIEDISNKEAINRANNAPVCSGSCNEDYKYHVPSKFDSYSNNQNLKRNVKRMYFPHHREFNSMQLTFQLTAVKVGVGCQRHRHILLAVLLYLKLPAAVAIKLLKMMTSNTSTSGIYCNISRSNKMAKDGNYQNHRIGSNRTSCKLAQQMSHVDSQPIFLDFVIKKYIYSYIEWSLITHLKEQLKHILL